MQVAASSAEFSFNNITYRKTEGIAMSSPVGTLLENIFVGYHENKLFDFAVKTTILLTICG